MTILGLRFGVDASALESKIMAELAVIRLELSTIKQGMHMDKTELAANLNAVADQANDGTGAIGAAVFCYDNDTTGGTDSAIVPISLHDFAVTPSGGDITVQINAAGFYRASGP